MTNADKLRIIIRESIRDILKENSILNESTPLQYFTQTFEQIFNELDKKFGKEDFGKVSAFNKVVKYCITKGMNQKAASTIAHYFTEYKLDRMKIQPAIKACVKDWMRKKSPLSESDASEEAHKDGLEYASFGRWKDPSTGKVVAHSKDGKLAYQDAEDAADDHMQDDIDSWEPSTLVKSGASQKDLDSIFVSKAVDTFKDTLEQNSIEGAEQFVRDQLDTVGEKVHGTIKKIESKLKSDPTSKKAGAYQELMNRYIRVSDAIETAHSELDSHVDETTKRQKHEEESESRYEVESDRRGAEDLERENDYYAKNPYLEDPEENDAPDRYEDTDETDDDDSDYDYSNDDDDRGLRY